MYYKCCIISFCDLHSIYELMYIDYLFIHISLQQFHTISPLVSVFCFHFEMTGVGKYKYYFCYHNFFHLRIKSKPCLWKCDESGKHFQVLYMNIALCKKAKFLFLNIIIFRHFLLFCNFKICLQKF